MEWLFDEIFGAVQDVEELDWYELFDSPDFDIVVDIIAQILGVSVHDLYKMKDFDKWVDEMAEEL